MAELLEPLTFSSGHTMKNRFVLAPLTNSQSHENGDLSDEEYRWLTMRAEGGFGLTMTCASHVQEIGKGFRGQLGIWDDRHIDGLSRLAAGIKEHNSLAIVQLHHAGMRSSLVKDLIPGAPVCPSDNEKQGARALSPDEVQQVIEDFVVAAERAKTAGFDGVELHGAHGYLLSQFFSPRINVRTDKYGGDVDGRFRILFEIIDGVRSRCGEHFLLGVRLSPERFGLRLGEIIQTARKLMNDGRIDFLDMSLWDVAKEPEEEEFKGRSLMAYFTDLERGPVRLGVAGKIQTPSDAESVMAAGLDWVMLGRAAIWNHDFPIRYRENHGFDPTPLPVTRQHLSNEGVSPVFAEYLASTWPENIAD